MVWTVPCGPFLQPSYGETEGTNTQGHPFESFNFATRCSPTRQGYHPTAACRPMFQTESRKLC